MSKLGENIKTARIKMGMTQEELAIAANTTKAAISRYELGKREPKVDMIVKIADILNVSVGYLQGRETIQTQAILDAMRMKDYATAEKLIGLPAGSIVPIPENEQTAIDTQLAQAQHEKEITLNKLRLYFRVKFDHLSEQDYLSIKALIDNFSQLNPEGQQKAIERIEELTEIPKYKKDPPQD